MRFGPVLLLFLSAPLGAQPSTPREDTVPAIPQPVVLDWGGEFRLNALPKNIGTDGLKKIAREEGQRTPAPMAAPSHAGTALGPEDPARERYSKRQTAVDENRLNVKAPVSAGPVSLGASYGKYRAIPAGAPNREVSADDMRVSLGIAF